MFPSQQYSCTSDPVPNTAHSARRPALGCLPARPPACLQVMAGALLEQAETLLDRGIHPLRIAEGYEMACKVALQRMDDIATTFDFSADNHESLVKTCMTTLSSKM